MTQRVLVEVPRADDVESRRLQGLRDQARVVRGGGERADLITGIADHECYPLFGRRGQGRHQRQQDRQCRPFPDFTANSPAHPQCIPRQIPNEE